MSNGKEETAEHYSKRLSVEEFFIDLLGGLVPGVLFIAAASAALFPSLHALWAALVWETNKEPDSLFKLLSNFLITSQNTPSTIWIMIFIVALLFAYLIGYLFYRFDPKNVDKASFKKLEEKLEGEEKDEKKANLGCENVDDCHFPYPYYADYLDQRGHYHLIKFVRWKAEEGDTEEEKKKKFRSKTYINLLKIRLRYYYPEKCGVIIRNEAHIRLASSAWYMSRKLIWISGAALIICLVSLGSTKYLMNKEWKAVWAWYLPNLLPPLLVGILFFSISNAIKGFFHYQRLREVFFVLETAHTAFRDRLDVLNPPFEKLSDEKNGKEIPGDGNQAVSKKSDKAAPAENLNPPKEKKQNKLKPE